jgi:hypothetical protein
VPCCRECLLWRVSAVESVLLWRVPAIQEFLLYKRVCYTRVCPNLKKEFLDVQGCEKDVLVLFLFSLRYDAELEASNARKFMEICIAFLGGRLGGWMALLKGDLVCCFDGKTRCALLLAEKIVRWKFGK